VKLPERDPIGYPRWSRPHWPASLYFGQATVRTRTSSPTYYQRLGWLNPSPGLGAIRPPLRLPLLGSPIHMVLPDASDLEQLQLLSPSPNSQVARPVPGPGGRFNSIET